MFINPKIGVNPEIIPVFQPMIIPSNTQGYVKIWKPHFKDCSLKNVI